MKRAMASIGGLFTHEASRPGSYPWGPINDALDSILVRLILFFTAMLASLSLGTAIACKSIAGFLVGIYGVHWVLIGGLFYSLGFFVFPAVLIFAILFIRYEWPLRTLVLPALAFVYVAYDSMDFSLNHSTQAKMEKQINAAIEQSQHSASHETDK